jgi:hypothetical protein
VKTALVNVLVFLFWLGVVVAGIRSSRKSRCGIGIGSHFGPAGGIGPLPDEFLDHMLACSEFGGRARVRPDSRFGDEDIH